MDLYQKRPSHFLGLRPIRKLQTLENDLESGKDFPVTRLTILKSMCEDPKLAAKFAVYIATCPTAARPGKQRSSRRAATRPSVHTALIDRAVS